MSEPFDFDKFIAGAELPAIPIPLVMKDRSAQITKLRAALARIPEEPGDEREHGSPERDDITKQIADLEAEQEASVRMVSLRALNPQEFKESVLADKADVFDQIAAMSKGTSNEAPRERWEAVAAKVTAAQWGEFVGKANDLALSKVAVPDFSQNSSGNRTALGLSAS